MGEQWRLQDGATVSDGRAAVRLIESRIASGEFETWFESDADRLMAVVTNGSRALVMVLSHVGDAGEHVIDDVADSPGSSGGFILAGGQVDTYEDRDTVPLALALDVVRCVIDHLEHPTVAWREDR